jgi:hypothetical protein
MIIGVALNHHRFRQLLAEDQQSRNTIIFS